MKMIAEYLERAHQFERMAAEAADNPELQANLQQQADAYYKLAQKRAEQTGIPLPQAPSTRTPSDPEKSDV